MISYYC